MTTRTDTEAIFPLLTGLCLDHQTGVSDLHAEMQFCPEACSWLRVLAMFNDVIGLMNSLCLCSEPACLASHLPQLRCLAYSIS